MFLTERSLEVWSPSRRFGLVCLPYTALFDRIFPGENYRRTTKSLLVGEAASTSLFPTTRNIKKATEIFPVARS